jgi:glutaredoxin
MIKMELLTMPGCAHCAAAKEVIGRIKGDYPEMEVEIIDVTEHPEASAKYMLMSAPGIVINGKLEFTGGVDEEVLKKRLNELKGG